MEKVKLIILITIFIIIRRFKKKIIKIKVIKIYKEHIICMMDIILNMIVLINHKIKKKKLKQVKVLIKRKLKIQIKKKINFI